MNLIGLVYVCANDCTKLKSGTIQLSVVIQMCHRKSYAFHFLCQMFLSNKMCLKSSWKLVDSNICLLSFRRGQTKWTFNESCIKSKDYPGATHLKKEREPSVRVWSFSFRKVRE